MAEKIVNDAFVLFGHLQMLPKELEEMGLGSKIEGVEEIPGIAPSWKPVKKGDFLLGKCVDIRPGIGKYESTALVFRTAVPGGFRTVWLGADLKIKMREPLNRVYSIYFDGTVDVGKSSEMKSYRVYEILPLTEDVPSDSHDVTPA